MPGLEELLKGLNLLDKKTNLIQEVFVEGVFLAVGQKPQNEAFNELLDTDETGYFYVGEDTLTNVEGIFAAGDARIKNVRQLTTAVGDVMADLAVFNFMP